MIFHENRLPADDSHEMSYLIFSNIRRDVTKFVVCCSSDWVIIQAKEGKFSYDMADVCVYSPIVELGKEMAALTA